MEPTNTFVIEYTETKTFHVYVETNSDSVEEARELFIRKYENGDFENNANLCHTLTNHMSPKVRLT